ncbi:MAG: type I 3-dehydroquinate dehydratase [Candidatus Thorarchaeota archaeon]
MGYNICAVIPVTSQDIVKTHIHTALKFNSNFIEYRFDYVQNIKDIKREFLNNINNLSPSNISLIFTFRDFTEGGRQDLNLDQKINVLNELFKAQPDYIDIEINSKNNLLILINDLAVDNNVKLIFSNHNFKNTKTLQESINLIKIFEEKLKGLNFSNATLNDSIFKIISTATKFSDNFIPLELCKYYKNQKKKIISFCMGDLGIFSRIFCLKTGAFLTYGSVEEITAPGQIKIEDLRKAIDDFT